MHMIEVPQKNGTQKKSGEVVFLIQMSTFIFFWLLRKLKVLGISMNLSCFFAFLYFMPSPPFAAGLLRSSVPGGNAVGLGVMVEILGI